MKPQIGADKERRIVQALVRHNTGNCASIEAAAITQAVQASSRGETTAEAIDYGIRVLDCLLWLDDLATGTTEPAIWE